MTGFPSEFESPGEHPSICTNLYPKYSFLVVIGEAAATIAVVKDFESTDAVR